MKAGKIRGNKWLVVGFLIAVVLALTLVFSDTQASHAVLYGMRHSPQRELTNAILRNVPIGSRVEQVTAFLDVQHLDHGRYERLSNLDSDTRYYPAGSPVLRAIKRHTAEGLLGFQSLRVVFVFDENGALTRFDVRPIYTTL